MVDFDFDFLMNKKGCCFVEVYLMSYVTHCFFFFVFRGLEGGENVGSISLQFLLFLSNKNGGSLFSLFVFSSLFTNNYGISI